ncbi:MAG: hypothetical protein V3V14_08375 [Saprospiraceae bacterium]
MTYYLAGGSTYNDIEYCMYAYMDNSGYPDGEYGERPIQSFGATNDPYWSLGLDTEGMVSGQQQAEFGLLDGYRIKCDSNGIFGYHVDSGSGWIDLFSGAGGGGASELADLSDVNLVSYEDGKVLRADGVDFEAGYLAHGDLSDAPEGAHHPKDHNNTEHTTNYEVANANIQSHVGTPPVDSHHAKYLDSEAVNAVETAGLDFGAHVNPISTDNVAQYSTFGRCQIGVNGSGYAYWGYVGTTANNFMIRQNSTFETCINSNTGKNLYFMINGASIAYFNAAELDMSVPIDMNSNAISEVSTLGTSGRVTINYTDDVTLVGVSGGLIVGGDGTGQHIAIDGNEIMSKLTATTVGTLYIQNQGGATTFGSGDVTSSGKIYNGVYNDYVDYIPLAKQQIKKAGMCYYETGEGLAICNKRNQLGAFGICSDTYGYATGATKGAVPISVAGIVLAYVDKVYKAGTLLVNSKTGILTKAKKKERYNALAMFMRKETKIKTKGVYVKSRCWVKIK